ncbi:MAG: hypothetical protein IKU86_02625, partial [Thermoguttaceae bacterium]|nr:hypothetical protein [Thermoguttaceae bacterium]
MQRPVLFVPTLAAAFAPTLVGCVSDSLKFARKPPAPNAPTPIVESVDYAEIPGAAPTSTVSGYPPAAPTPSGPFGGFYESE